LGDSFRGRFRQVFEDIVSMEMRERIEGRGIPRCAHFARNEGVWKR